MIVIVIQNSLATALGLPVYQEKPEIAPDRYVLIDKTGSGKRNKLPSVTIVFQSYAESKYQASLLNEQVKTAVENLVSLDEIASIRLNSDYPFPDITTKQHRYQAVYDIKHY